jgi:hypothetical protein
MAVTCRAQVDASGRLAVLDRATFAAACRAYAGQALELVLRPASRRSVPANRRYWALLAVAARSLGWDDGPEALHEALAQQLLPLPTDPRTGLPRRQRTPTLASPAFTEYVDTVEAYLTHLGADLTGWQDEAAA